MKTSKKKILIIVLLLTAYFSFGYYYGQSWVDASIKSLNDEPISFFQKVQLGGWKWLTIVDVNDSPLDLIAIIDLIAIMLLSVFLWIFVFIFAVGGSWIAYAVFHGAIAFFHGIVLLFEFICYDGFFRLFGPVGSCLVIGLIVVLMVLIVRKLLVVKV